MTINKHNGITFTLIGLLLPFFGSVCLASGLRYNKFISGSIDYAEETVAFEKQEIPGSKSGVKQGVDFINRLQKNHFLYTKFSAPDTELLNDTPQDEALLLPFYLVPKPAYYNYLFMLKPF